MKSTSTSAKKVRLWFSPSLRALLSPLPVPQQPQKHPQVTPRLSSVQRPNWSNRSTNRWVLVIQDSHKVEPMLTETEWKVVKFTVTVLTDMLQGPAK